MSLVKTIILFVMAGAVFSSPTKTGKTSYGLDINEEGLDFQEQIEIDEEENVERIEVPSHHDVTATVFIHDFNLNLTLRSMAGQDECFLTDLAESLERGQATPPSKLKNTLEEAKTSHQVSDDMTVVVNQWMMGSLVEDDVLSQLSGAMRRECPHQRIRWLFRIRDYLSVHSGTRSDVRGLHSRTRRDTQLDTSPNAGPNTNAEEEDVFAPTCQPQNLRFRCKKELISCQYIYYETCNAERYRRGRRMFAQCIDNSTLHIIDEVKCCRECCSDQSQADDFFRFCEAIKEFSCSGH